jgi:excisionase family DNA binding protein
MESPISEKHALTIPEACAFSGIGKTKLYEAINSGGLKAHKLGKRTLILADDLREYLSSLPLIVPTTEMP